MALEDYRADMERCSRCSYCKWIPFDHIKSWRFSAGCPSIAYEKFQAYSAGGRLAVSLSLLDGRSEITDRFVDIVYKCQMDGLCDIADKVCRYNMEPLKIMRELRNRLVEEGEAPPQHLITIDGLRKEDNMMLRPKSERGRWVDGLTIKDLNKEKVEVVFHAGCRFSFDSELQNVARTVISILNNVGIDVGILGANESCCGGRAFDLGFHGEYTKFSQHNIETWTNAGVKTVITACADCYFTFKRLYPQNGSKFEILHTVEFLERLLKEKRIKLSNKIPLNVTYHDPCHLGRLGESYMPWEGVEKKVLGQMVVYDPPKPRQLGANGIYEPPRNILRSIEGLNLVEMERNREFAWCCGAGGGVIDAYPEFAQWSANERIEEAKAAGAEAIVTACPWCERNLTDAARANGSNVKIYDIIELLKQAM
jgi:Fe-S oxidoreductase